MVIKPEYLALTISTLAIIISVYISWRNRKYDFAKQEYLKLQQIAEKIISALLLIENDRQKLILFFEKSLEAKKTNATYHDLNNTFNRATFDKKSLEIVTLIEIYFHDLGKQWNSCMDCMSKMFTIIFLLKTDIDNGKVVNWQDKAKFFNDASRELNKKPQDISNSIKSELKRFRKKYF
ncbi:hypothetical protein KAS41_04615 [Candidatus Parcubacteria bacterium]|nr:hypothetical protein [Candidatus Parcubacteria bacterium]